MTNEEAKKMLEAKLKCLIAETSGTNHDCNMRLCDGCALNYEQGNMGEQKQALDMAIKTLEQTRWIPVSERLPKFGEKVLLHIINVDNIIFDIACLKDTKHAAYDGDYYWSGKFAYRLRDVVAWMSLPEPYKTESEG